MLRPSSAYGVWGEGQQQPMFADRRVVCAWDADDRAAVLESARGGDHSFGVGEFQREHGCPPLTAAPSQGQEPLRGNFPVQRPPLPPRVAAKIQRSELNRSEAELLRQWDAVNEDVEKRSNFAPTPTKANS